MVIKEVSLETVCGITSRLPQNQLPEIAFAGRSNVGKSTLINGILNRKNFAHTSSTPGKTQTINFYNVNHTFYLVDLPGYGYTNANLQVRVQWGKMTERYLHTSRQLRAVFLLVDIRHMPFENDRRMYEWIVQGGFAPVVVATKADKIKPREQYSCQSQLRTGLGADDRVPVLPYSGLTRLGREGVLEQMDRVLGMAPSGGCGI